MIKSFFLFFTVLTLLSAQELKSFSADFNQTITDEYNKTINYVGNIIAYYPSNVKYNYTYPMKKSVYIMGKKVIIIEDELEQVIVKELNSEINLFEILSNAKKRKDGTFISKYQGYEFRVTKKDNIPSSLLYKDELDNTIYLEFLNSKSNLEINENMFKPYIPTYYDIIKE